MKAVLVGMGGIGKNVYLPELERIGFDVYTVDRAKGRADYESIFDLPNRTYELGVVATPNFTHYEVASQLSALTNRIFVDKPGVGSYREWQALKTSHPSAEFTLIKNNLYRNSLTGLTEYFKSGQVESIELLWMNKNRIPNPGSWFTNEETAFGGVAHDLFPHLYCFLYMICNKIDLSLVAPESHNSFQRWNLSKITNTDYGVVDPKGKYNVCDYAEDFLSVLHMDAEFPVTLRASWKEGYDEQSVRLNLKDGTSVKYEFGLCPAEAYGRMFEDALLREAYTRQQHEDLDRFIHLRLEAF